MFNVPFLPRAIRVCKVYVSFQHCADDFVFGAFLVSLKLRRDTLHGAQGFYGDEFALGRRELVGSVDVAVTWPFISRGSFDPARS